MNGINDIRNRSVLEMSAEEARRFFLKHESYCKIDLPPYFTFDLVLNEVANYLHNNDLNLRHLRQGDFEHINHLLLSNKDGRYAWRPLEIIHPVLYVDLVKSITDPDNWNLIQRRFLRFRTESNVECMSIPVESRTDYRDIEEQIFVWWRDIEQRSIELTLEFEFLAHTDITDCYGQIYTHSIAWALHDREVARNRNNRRNYSLVGNKIDRSIQDMRYGQTNGIPQGSVLMDFIAEMVLGYADINLSRRLNDVDPQSYRILRYRDDYRIFARSKCDAEEILKALTEVLSDLGLKLNSEKTVISDNIIQSSIKQDKLAWLFRVQEADSLEKYLLILHDHALHYPNSGSLLRGLVEFRRMLDEERVYSNPMVLISIVVEITYSSPRTYPICMAIISRLLRFFQNNLEIIDVFKKILKKFDRIPNTGYMEVWLQRVALPLGITARDIDRQWSECLCRIVEGEEILLWENEWIEEPNLRQMLNVSIVDENRINSLQVEIDPIEYELFLTEY